jgi:hypothetical protein
MSTVAISAVTSTDTRLKMETASSTGVRRSSRASGPPIANAIAPREEDPAQDLVEEGLAEEGLEDEEEDRPHTEEAGIDTSPVVLVVVTTALLVAITDRRIARH